MKRFSRIEELAMRNTMHTVEWCGDVKFKKNGTEFEVDVHCTLDGDEIDFDILSDGSKEYILDMILFEKIKEGTFVEIFPEPVEDDEAYPFTYSTHNGYED